MQDKHNNKEEVIRLLKEGVVNKSQLARDFHIPRSTISLWYDLEYQRNPEEFKVPPEKPLPVEEINSTEAKVCTVFADYVYEDVTDSDWDDIQRSVNRILTDFAKEVQSHS